MSVQVIMCKASVTYRYGIYIISMAAPFHQYIHSSLLPITVDSLEWQPRENQGQNASGKDNALARTAMFHALCAASGLSPNAARLFLIPQKWWNTTNFSGKLMVLVCQMGTTRSAKCGIWRQHHIL